MDGVVIKGIRANGAIRVAILLSKEAIAAYVDKLESWKIIKYVKGGK